MASDLHIMRVSLWQRAASYFSPITLWKGSSPISRVLELLLFQGRFQLATIDALYSDGDRYRPLVAGFRAVRHRLKNVRSVLVLGAGLGSAVDVLQRFGAQPETTLVELDEVVARWGREVLRKEDRDRVRFVVDDAQAFIQRDQTQYDLVIVDVFTGREPLPFATEEDFLCACRRRLTSQGIFLLNYMQNPGSPPWEQPLKRIEAVFDDARTLAFGPNRVIVWENKAC